MKMKSCKLLLVLSTVLLCIEMVSIYLYLYGVQSFTIVVLLCSQCVMSGVNAPELVGLVFLIGCYLASK